MSRPSPPSLSYVCGLHMWKLTTPAPFIPIQLKLYIRPEGWCFAIFARYVWVYVCVDAHWNTGTCAWQLIDFFKQSKQWISVKYVQESQIHFKSNNENLKNHLYWTLYSQFYRNSTCLCDVWFNKYSLFFPYIFCRNKNVNTKAGLELLKRKRIETFILEKILLLILNQFSGPKILRSED